jgi:hypothetical protein
MSTQNFGSKSTIFTYLDSFERSWPQNGSKNVLHFKLWSTSVSNESPEIQNFVQYGILLVGNTWIFKFKGTTRQNKHQPGFKFKHKLGCSANSKTETPFNTYILCLKFKWIFVFKFYSCSNYCKLHSRFVFKFKQFFCTYKFFSACNRLNMILNRFKLVLGQFLNF